MVICSILVSNQTYGKSYLGIVKEERRYNPKFNTMTMEEYIKYGNQMYNLIRHQLVNIQ